MSEARELDTNLDTMVGHNLDAPWVGNKNFPEMEGEDFPCHQPSDDEPEFYEGPRQEQQDEEDAQEFVPTEAEKDAASRLRALTAAVPRASKGVKRPRSPVARDDDEVPDLAEIFDNYDTPHLVRISICRAYASYIASLQPKKPKKAASKRKH